MRTIYTIATVALMTVCSHVGAADLTHHASGNDAYISGYISAVLDMKFHLQHVPVRVHDGDVNLGDVPMAEQNAVSKALREIQGVKSVQFTQPKPLLPQSDLSQQAMPQANTGITPETQRSPNNSIGKFPIAMDTKAMEQAGVYHLPTGFLPPGRLFQPLIADPKWPTFSVAYTYYSPYHPNSLKDVIPVSIGDTIPFERGNWPDHWQWETGMQADAFAYFNMDTVHSDLQNTDFQVGGYFAVRHRNFSLLVRYYHQSSHLGDEFLIANPAYYNGLRQKISYEELNAIASIDLLHRMIRLYAGAGYLGDVAPANLGHWRFHYGAEYHGTAFYHKGTCYISPVAGIDFKNWSENNYATDISAVGGIQLSNGKPDSSKLQFLLEFYRGHSPYGQFFVNKIQYFGLGIHFYF